MKINLVSILLLSLNLVSCLDTDQSSLSEAQYTSSKSIYGSEDNRTIPSLHGDELLQEISKSVVVLTRSKKTPITSGFCSGTIIKKDNKEYLVTAGHCIKSYDDCNFNVVANFEENSDLKQVIKSCSKILFLGKNSPDMAIVKLADDENHIPALDFKISKPQLNTPLAVIGHPEGLAKKITDECQIQNEPGRKFNHQCDTFSGNSGSITVNLDDYGFTGILISGRKDRTRSGELIRYTKGSEYSTNIFYYKSILEDVFKGLEVKGKLENERHYYIYSEDLNITCDQRVEVEHCFRVIKLIEKQLNTLFDKDFSKLLDLSTIHLTDQNNFIQKNFISANDTQEEIIRTLLKRRESIKKKEQAAYAVTSNTMRNAMFVTASEQNDIHIQCGFAITDKEACKKTIQLIVDALKKYPNINLAVLGTASIFIEDSWSKNISIQIPLGASKEEIERRFLNVSLGGSLITNFESSGIKINTESYFTTAFGSLRSFKENIEQVFSDYPKFNSISLDLKTIYFKSYNWINTFDASSLTFTPESTYDDIVSILEKRYTPQFK
ncbi:hypothetical protein A9Q84_00580 [Halobacteriovorax marinus]|uniref:Peptidase S1 domain-containing protein n=1 Tax=Halobacteriovorax marinus TaxID=97084 RepID=A0A1Y5FBQ9_9BACT|nr:hypothetical protein A9Q84_00580 [Halobacteriovorax marinus]